MEALKRDEALRVKLGNAKLIANRLRYWVETGRKPYNEQERQERTGAIDMAKTMLGSVSDDIDELLVGMEDLAENIKEMLEEHRSAAGE